MPSYQNDETPNPAGSFLQQYMASRAMAIKEERDTEDKDRNARLTAYYHAIQNADKLGLSEDDLRVLYNQVGDALGHKPDPKLFGIFGVGDKGAKGPSELGDLIFPQSRRDQSVSQGARELPQTPQSIQATASQFPASSPTDQYGIRTDSTINQQDALQAKLGPAPEPITARRGSIPISDLEDQSKLKLKEAMDHAATNENIRQAQESSKGQIQFAYDGQGNLKAFTFDPIKKTMTAVPMDEGMQAVSTVNGNNKVNKEFNEELNLINEDPGLKDLPNSEKRAIAANRVADKHKAELAKTLARTGELTASTNLKRARTQDILNPRMTPYQAARIGQQKQGLELQAARLAISQGTFDQTSSKTLVGDLKSFYSMRDKALKLITEGNQANTKFQTSKADLDKTTATGKWREGYAALAQAKMLAQTMHSKYPGMVNIANTDPNDQMQYPWVETNFDVPQKGQSKEGGSGTGKRSFTPSPTTSKVSKDQYIQMLKGKNIPQATIDQKVQQYYPNQ